ncbi:MAG: tRNA uracil 4-sulfurtransferase ThiI [Chloroflexota bacterium]|nr:tRNA uracil 4-sulfurtransferase ThiI [Chloroflexota bacterium]
MKLVVLRYGELSLKGGNRREYIRRLRQNVRSCLAGHNMRGRVESVHRRLYVWTDQADAAAEHLGRIFGLSSVSPAVAVPRDMSAIVAEGVRQAREAGGGSGVSFRVRVKRADKTFPYISPEIERLVGRAVLGSVGGTVDLSDDADLTIGVEVSRERAIVFHRVVPGFGGFPVGIEGRVVALISGGIDSPVAAWMMMKRGCGVVPLHFAQNEIEKRKALDNIEVLKRYSYGWDLRPIIEDHQELIADLLERLRRVNALRWTCIFCKRALLLRASRIAEDLGAHAVVMGDSLGQVASQSLANLEAISSGIPKPVLRPLIGMEKLEIIELAKKIGTFGISIRAQQECPFLPAHPITAADMDEFREIKQAIGM